MPGAHWATRPQTNQLTSIPRPAGTYAHSQLRNRVTAGVDVPGRGRTPWFSMEQWHWEGSAPEGLPLVSGRGVALPPLPLTQYGDVRLNWAGACLLKGLGWAWHRCSLGVEGAG